MLKLRTLKCNRKAELMLDFYIHKTRFLHLKSSVSLNLTITQCSIFQIIFKMKKQNLRVSLNSMKSQSTPSLSKFLFDLLG